MIGVLYPVFVLGLQMHGVSGSVKDRFNTNFVTQVFEGVNFVPSRPYVDGRSDAFFQFFVVGDDLFRDDEIVHGRRR